MLHKLNISIILVSFLLVFGCVEREDIIGEERVGNGIDFAERMMQEAERMWNSRGWRVESMADGVVVESKQVSGVFESANILVMRSDGEINSHYQDVFEFLISPEGYAVLDPVSKPEDHQLPLLETYTWRENTRLEAATARAKIPFMEEVDFVVLNAIDYSTCIFVSKSIIHDSIPGGSKYSSEPPVSGSKIRALNTFAVKVEPIDENKCRLQFINYVDMGIDIPSFIYDFTNRLFLALIYSRINDEMAKN